MPNSKKIWFPLPVDEYHDPHQENGVTIHSDGRIDIYDCCGGVADLDSDQADMLYQALIDRARGIAAFIPETADREDAAEVLAGLDDAVGNPMAEPGAVVASVPVPVKTGGATQ